MEAITVRQIDLHTQVADTLTKIFGEDFEWDDGVLVTAGRVVKAWQEFVPREMDFQVTVFERVANQMIAVTGITFSSICMHHLLPFMGEIHVAYLPNRKQVGLSKIPRIVEHFSRQPQVQERLTHQIASFLKDTLEPQGVAVVARAQHTCMSCRGVRKQNADMVTSEMRGVFLTAGEARSEFLSLIS